MDKDGFTAGPDGHEELKSKVKGISRSQSIMWALLALLALAAIPGFIALERYESTRNDGTVAVVNAGSARSVDAGSAAADTQASSGTILSISGTAPEGYAARGTLASGAGAWVNRASFPAPGAQGMSDGAAVRVHSKIYHIGGHVGNPTKGNVVSPAVFIYDPLLDTFTAGPALPIPAARGAAAWDGESTIYYVAGVTTTPDGGTDHAGKGGKNCLYTLDVSNANATWAAKPCMGPARSDFCAAWAQGKLYTLGGYDPQYNILDAIMEYDPAANAWKDSGMKLPSARGDVQCAAVGGSIYAVGGVTTFDEGISKAEWFTNEMVEVDVVGRQVRARAALPGPGRGDVAIAALTGNTLMVAGGEVGNDARTTIGVHDVAVYDVTADAWVVKAPMPGARFRGSAAAATLHGGAVAAFVFGGHHRCEVPADDEDPTDDGGCDEIAPVAAFFEAPTPNVYVYAPQGEGTPQLSEVAKMQQAVVSPLPALTGYRYRGSLTAGGGFWAQKANLPMPRSDFHAHTVGNKIYLVGGLNGANKVQPQVDVYDPVLDVMVPGAQFPSGQFRHRYASGILDGKIYVASGLNSSDFSAVQLKSLLVWDVESKKFTAGPSMATARSDACGAAVGGKFYVAGGYSENYASTLQSVEVFDPATGKWAAAPNLPAPRGDCMATAQDGVLYVAGGFYDEGGTFAPDSYHETLFALDTRVPNPQWEERAAIPVARGDGMVVGLGDGRLLFVGGETHNNGAHTKVATHDVYVYYVQQDVWVPKAPLPQARFRFAAAVHNGVAYAFGGHATCPAEDGGKCHETAHSLISAYYEAPGQPLFVHVKV